MSNRDEEMFKKLKPILQEYDIKYQSSGDIITDLYEKISYDYLKKQAIGLEWIPKKEQQSKLYRLKEESYAIKIDEIKRLLEEEGLGHFRYDDKLEETRARKTEHKTKFNKVSAEVYHNELIRQLSDLPYGSEVINGYLYVKPSDSLIEARKQYETLTGKTWKIPKTTFKHEAVVLDNEIGKALVKNEDVTEEIKALDPHYNYRSLARRYRTASKASNFVLSSFMEKQISHLKTDVGILQSYEKQVNLLKERGLLTDDVTVPENLSVKDKIEQYRKILSGNVYDIADVAPVETPALLDLVEHRKNSDNILYRSTVKDLAGTLQLSDRKAQQLAEKNVPLSAWKKVADDITATKKKLQEEYDKNVNHYDSLSQLEFDTELQQLSEEDLKKKRSSLPFGYTRKIKGHYYRTGKDKDLISVLDQERKQKIIREERILAGPEKEHKSAVGQTRLSGLFAKQNTDLAMLQKAVEVSGSKNFSASYDALTAEQKKFYNRNYGVPIKQDNIWYRSIYDMPYNVWTQAEKAAGYDTPRPRGGITAVSVNIAEEKLQQEITEKLEQKVWEPIEKKVTRSVNREQPEIPVKEQLAGSPITVAANGKLQQETKDNLRKMLTNKNNVKTGAIGSMGLMAAFYLAAAASDAPSEAALEHRRRVEEERRNKKYG